MDEPISTSLPEDEQIDLLYRRAFVAECNQAGARLLGFSDSDEMTGARVTDIWPPSSTSIRELNRTFIRGGYHSANIEADLLDRDKNRVPVLLNSTGIVESAWLVRIWVTATDITARKGMEQALRESEERVRQIAENIQDVFWLEDRRSGQFIYVSAAYESIWSRPAQELLENPAGWIEHVHAEDRPPVGIHLGEPLGDGRLASGIQGCAPRWLGSLGEQPRRFGV